MSRAHTLHNLNFTSFVQHTHTRTQYIQVQCSASRTGLVKHLITLYRRYTFLHFSQVQPFLLDNSSISKPTNFNLLPENPT
jgi:hypothetical protein